MTAHPVEPHIGQRLADVTALINEHNVHTVEIAISDTYGHLRGKRVPAQRFISSVAVGGAHTAEVIYAMDVQCEIIDTPIIGNTSGYLDMHLVPDLTTFRVLHHRPGYATVMVDAIDVHHQPHPLDPRAQLAKQIERIEALGYQAIVATELECYICWPDWTPAQSNVQYSSLTDNLELEVCVAEMRAALLDLQIPIESSNPEYGPGQLEINFSAADPMRTADSTQLYKATIKEIARRHGLRATFMPKPFAGQSGNGLHVHSSLSQNGLNVFGRGDGHLLNDVMRHWVGGLIHHAPALQLLGIPFGNGYKRVRPFTFCPTHVSWGGDNRTVLARCTVDQGGANRVEYRAAGADANPYLYFAALLAAGVDGLERSLDPGPMAVGDVYSEPGSLALLPCTFDSAIAAFSGSELGALLGGDLATNFMALTANEVALYAANASGEIDDVTAWEFARYREFT
jgi:glutamine synthetase